MLKFFIFNFLSITGCYSQLEEDPFAFPKERSVQIVKEDLSTLNSKGINTYKVTTSAEGKVIQNKFFTKDNELYSMLDLVHSAEVIQDEILQIKKAIGDDESFYPYLTEFIFGGLIDEITDLNEENQAEFYKRCNRKPSSKLAHEILETAKEMKSKYDQVYINMNDYILGLTYDLDNEDKTKILKYEIKALSQNR